MVRTPLQHLAAVLAVFPCLDPTLMHLKGGSTRLAYLVGVKFLSWQLGHRRLRV